MSSILLKFTTLPLELLAAVLRSQTKTDLLASHGRAPTGGNSTEQVSSEIVSMTSLHVSETDGACLSCLEIFKWIPPPAGEFHSVAEWLNLAPVGGSFVILLIYD